MHQTHTWVGVGERPCGMGQGALGARLGRKLWKRSDGRCPGVKIEMVWEEVWVLVEVLQVQGQPSVISIAGLGLPGPWVAGQSFEGSSRVGATAGLRGALLRGKHSAAVGGTPSRDINVAAMSSVSITSRKNQIQAQPSCACC